MFTRLFQSVRRMASSSVIPQIKDVDIDPNGVFKYILIKVTSPDECGKLYNKLIVRGYAECPYHCEYYFFTLLLMYGLVIQVR